MRFSSRVARAAALFAALMLVTACTGDSGSEAADPTESASSPSQAASPTPDLDAEAIDLAPAGPQTAAGTALDIGSPGWFETSGTIDGQELGGTVGITVLEIRELDASVLVALGNQEILDQGFVPYAVIFEHQWFYEAPEGYRHEPVQGLYPLLPEGVSAAFLSTDGGITPALDMCGLSLPSYDEERQIGVDCMVALGENDNAIVGMKFTGEKYGYAEASEGNPFVADPVTWVLPRSL